MLDNSPLKILFLGDIVGSPGRKVLKKTLPELIKLYEVDLVLANGENIAGGVGLTEATAKEVFEAGVHLLTTGNHVFDKKDSLNYLHQNPFLIRPQNYPPSVPGNGYAFIETRKGKVGVLNLQGRVFMPCLDCPFRVAEEVVTLMRKETSIIVVDFHAEATSEKQALANYLSGKVSAVVGTHTHVQTADERIIPPDTLFITDVGMVGSLDSIIGVNKKEVINRFITQMPNKFEVPEKGPVVIEAVLLVIGEEGKGVRIERIRQILTPPFV